ncbi:hypothetical protein KEM55_004312 [Ascosphaera atra]|nr:hypothetical protein KEM55_004312 [Ascosphaera atra]
MATSKCDPLIFKKKLTVQLRGPNWIHGTDNNPINDLCKVTSTVTHGFEGPHLVMGQDGTPVPTATASVAADFVWTLIEKTIDWSLQNQSKIPAHLDVFEYMKAKIEESDLSKEEKGHCIESSKVWGSYIGSPIDRQSLKFFFMEGGVEGGKDNNLPLDFHSTDILVD